MQVGFAEDGALVVSGESAQDQLALKGWHDLWRARGVQFRIVIPESFIARPQRTTLVLVETDTRPGELDDAG